MGWRKAMRTDAGSFGIRFHFGRSLRSRVQAGTRRMLPRHFRCYLARRSSCITKCGKMLKIIIPMNFK